MAHWLKPRPLLVLTLLLGAPAVALAHLLLTWVPQRQALVQLVHEIPGSTAVVADKISALRDNQQAIAALERIADRHEHVARRCWLEQRQRNHVSDVLAKALQSGGVTLDQLLFDDVALFTAGQEGEVLACERVSVSCHGPYAEVTRALDCMARLSLPIHMIETNWQREDEGISLSMEFEIPFAPAAALARDLRFEAGFDTEDDDDEL